ncbi:serine hydrolase domain-containing protein [Chondrinema litorale]|uniref:serine hydrolase domain-containing protein n=1 Tax=Chondrinema litorale TaxID=2994555 RepID=UPI002542736C|nr:serine hydrolase domain-containing protein [Chondrinema litorale]UZR98086.1 serine hydrolase [Chondrinema litorale]
MKTIYFFTLVLLILSGCANNKIVPVANTLQANGDIEPNQQELIFNCIKDFPNNTELSLAIIENGKVKFYGVKRENDSVSDVVNRKSAFEIGSITKVFTSTLLANYALEGKLKLDENINQYLNFTLKNNTPITFISLANHTSGLPRMPSNFMLSAMLSPDNPYKDYDEAKLKAYLTEELTLTEENGKPSYSNLGAGLLGYTLSKVSGKDYQTMLQEKIFSKYNMLNSTTNRNELKVPLVKGLDKDGDVTSNWDIKALVGAGGILSNTEDLSKFAMAQFNSANEELTLTRKKTYVDNTSYDMGLGWHVSESKSGGEVYWHNGGTGGYRTCMALDMPRKNAVIVLSNISAFNNESTKIDKLCFELAKTLKEKTGAESIDE